MKFANQLRKPESQVDENKEPDTSEFEDKYICYEFENSAIAILDKLRWESNRNLNILITSKGHTRGLGKTTLAVWLCNQLERNGTWKAREQSVVGDFWQHKLQHQENKAGSWLLFDELERAIDRRNAMSKSNKEFRKVLSTYRDMGISKIYTAPSKSLIDRGVLAFFDVWINVIRQGVALQWYLMVPDTGRNQDKLQFYQLKSPVSNSNELLHFPDIKNTDRLARDIAYLDMIKHNMIESDTTTSEDLVKREKVEEMQKEYEKRIEKEKLELRNSFLKLITENCTCTYKKDWAELVSESDLPHIEPYSLSPAAVTQATRED